jgi:hypothetical protein
MDKMNKKANIFTGFLLAFFIFMLSVWMLPFMKDGATDMRTNLDCTNHSVTDGNKVSCLLADGSIPYIMIILFTFIGGLIGREL